MCGRYTLFAKREEIIEAFELDEDISDYRPSYNIAPGQDVLAIIHDGRQKRAGYLKWGLVPSWAKDEKIGYKMINARSETAHEKLSFKNLMARKRCLIVADGFYEWQQTEEKKQPYRIHSADRKLFAFAGLWDKWEKNGKVVFTCTILTKDADAYMRHIHHRRPIILPKDEENIWIKPNGIKPSQGKQFLTQVNSEQLNAYPVGTYVNKAMHNDETCIQPLVD